MPAAPCTSPCRSFLCLVTQEPRPLIRSSFTVACGSWALLAFGHRLRPLSVGSAKITRHSCLKSVARGAGDTRRLNYDGQNVMMHNTLHSDWSASSTARDLAVKGPAPPFSTLLDNVLFNRRPRPTSGRCNFLHGPRTFH